MSFLFLMLVVGASRAQQPESAPGDTASQPEKQPETQPATQPTTQPATQPASQPTTAMAPETADVTTEKVNDLIKQVEAAANLDEAAKTQLLDLYKKALEQLSVAESWKAKSADYVKGREEAPALLKTVRSRLAQAASQPTTQPVLDVPEDATAEDLALKLADAESKLKEKQQLADKLEEEAKNRASRRLAVPQLLTEANKRLEEVNKAINAPPVTGVTPQVAEARRMLTLAQRDALQAEIKAYDGELRFYDARSDVLSAFQDEAKQEVSKAEALVAAWQKKVSERRQEEVERQKRMAEKELETVPEPVRAIAEVNASLAKERADLSVKMDQVTQSAKAANELLKQLSAGLDDLRSKVTEPGMEAYLGTLLREQRGRLPDVRDYRRRRSAREEEISRARVRALELEELRAPLADLGAAVNDALEKLKQFDPSLPVEALRTRVRQLLETRLETVTDLKGDYQEYRTDLMGVSISEAKVLAMTAEFQEFLSEYMLWIRSTVPLHQTELPESPQVEAKRWVGLARSLWADVLIHPITYAPALLVAIWFAWVRRRLKARLRSLGEQVTRASSDSFGMTLSALVWTLAICLLWPAVLWFTGWRVAASAESTDEASYELALSIGTGLNAAATIWLALLFIYEMCREKGLVLAHFRWNPSTARGLRTHLRWLLPVSVLAGFVVYTAEDHPDPSWADSVGRLAFLVWMVALAYFAHRVLHPTHGVFSARFQRKPSGGLYKLRYFLYGGMIAIPLLLGLTSAGGYAFTAIQFRGRLAATVLFILLLLIFHELMARWVFAAQRKLALEEAKKKREAQAEAEGQAGGGESLKIDEEDTLNVITIGDQAKKLMRSVVVLGLILGVWFIWSDIFPAFRFLDRKVLWEVPVPTGEDGSVTRIPVTLANLLLAILIGAITVGAAKNIPGLLEITVLRWLPMDPGGRYAATTLVRYAIILVGLIAAFGAIEIGWSQVQWLAAAITLGLGFGLQEIFANFVSGIILLFERPIRVGDIVTVSGVDGIVTRIRMRATTITNWDRKELVVPNKEFITGQLMNWTLTDKMARLVVPVGVAYGTDVELARELMLKVATESEYVLDDPAPIWLFKGFGDNALQLELLVYVPNRDNFLNLITQMHMGIDREFRQAGIEISFPQRDIHIRSIEGILRTAQESSDS